MLRTLTGAGEMTSAARRRATGRWEAEVSDARVVTVVADGVAPHEADRAGLRDANLDDRAADQRHAAQPADHRTLALVALHRDARRWALGAAAPMTAHADRAADRRGLDVEPRKVQRKEVPGAADAGRQPREGRRAAAAVLVERV